MSNELFTRHRRNPPLTANRCPYTISAVMNTGAAAGEDSALLLFTSTTDEASAISRSPDLETASPIG